MRSCCHCVEAGVLQVGGERLEQLGVGDDVAADFLGGARGDVQVAVRRPTRGCRAGARGSRRCRRRAAAATAASASSSAKRVAMWRIRIAMRQFRLARSVSSAAGRHRRSVARTSRPGFGRGTSNRLLTARARSLQARKIAGGSSTIACWKRPHAVAVLVVGRRVADAIECGVDRAGCRCACSCRAPSSASSRYGRNRLGPLTASTRTASKSPLLDGLEQLRPA